MSLKRSIIIAPLGLLSLTVLSGVFLISSYSYATDDNVVDNININVPISCSMEGTGMTSHNANIVNGTYQADIGTTTIKAYCNDSSGFAIYAIGYTDDEYGKNVLTNTTLGSTADIVTGTATSGSTSNWAMKLTIPSSPTPTYPLTLDNSFGNYHSVPSEYTKVAHRDSATDIGTNAEGSTLTSTYAAFMSQTQPAGTYTGKVKYTLVHPATEEPLQPQPATAGCINYFANASTAIGEMGCQSASNNASVTLWASNFSRSGYGFAGWNDKFDYSGNFYGPNETITAPSDVQTNGLSLYAVWIKSAGTIQNWNGCSSLTQGSTTALTDERDGNTYAVAKLADGKCWTIENLRLADKDSSNNDIELSSTNTHNLSLPLTNIYDSSTTSNHLSPTSPLAYDATTAPEGWCTTNSSTCDDQSRLRTDNTTLFTNNTSSSYSASSNVYSYGNYYNWYSATAGHGKYGSSYEQGYESPGDICPAGWHLPKGGNKSQESTNEFWQLIVTGLNGGTNPANYDSSTTPYYNGAAEATPVSNALRTYPNNFVYSGRVSGSSVYDRVSYGYYWSSSAYSSGSAYLLYLRIAHVHPGTSNGNKYSGRMVRCVVGV